MLINLKAYATNNAPTLLTFELHERLPVYIKPPCYINCQVIVKNFSNYYLIMLRVETTLNLICQRCLDTFSYNYANQTTLAACCTDELAEKMMEDYECVVASNNQIDLIELVTDELHLCTPQFHLSPEDCNDEAMRFILHDGDTIITPLHE